jgi:phytoene dehydrogenase-like protein
MKKKSVIIIGSGLGGLYAGNLLARKGHRVTIFESHSAPGGYTAGFTRKGFYFESGTLSFESSFLVFKAMRELGLMDRVDFVRHQARWVTDDFAGTPESYGEFKEMLLQAYPGQAESLRAFFRDVEPIYEGMSGLNEAGASRSLRGLPPLLLSLLKMARGYPKFRGLTVPEFTRKYFPEGSTLYRLFNGFGYPDSGAVMLGGALCTIFEDYWTVRQGMQAWADALAVNFSSLGGELRLRSRVDRILTRDGAAVGVECGGEPYYADRVISACDYKKTFLEMLDDRSLVPAEELRRIEEAPVSEGIFTVYLGLDMPMDQLARRMQHHYVFRDDEAPGFDVHDSSDERFFEKSSVSLFSPSLLNPALAPEGKSSLMLQAICPHRWLDNWGGGDRERYREMKERVTEVLIDKASAVVPELKEHIEVRDAATPLTYERYTGNTDGATSAWSWNPHNRFHKSIMGVNVGTPVENLYIGSCWAMQIGGVPGALMAARKCARKIR